MWIINYDDPPCVYNKSLQIVYFNFLQTSSKRSEEINKYK